MRSLYGDWRAPGLTVCLHEHAGGYAFNRESMLGPRRQGPSGRRRDPNRRRGHGLRARQLGRGHRGPHDRRNDRARNQVVVAVGPWIASLWAMLGLPDRIDVRQPDGGVQPDLPMWTYWYLQEGEIEFDPAQFVTDDGRASPCSTSTPTRRCATTPGG